MNAQSATASAARTQPDRNPQGHVGDHLREWRQRRHLSQLDLAGDAEISARHLSFVETGRAAPSRDMVLRLEVPLRERNVLLVAAGFAPAFPQRPLDDPAPAPRNDDFNFRGSPSLVRRSSALICEASRRRSFR
jgi:transcriptional regulator with XRE-family HTH domain